MLGLSACDVNNQVVPSSTLGEIFLSVINHLVGAQRADQLHTAGAAYGRHLGAKHFGDGYG